MWKNGPSAGGGIAVAMMSCFLKRPAKQSKYIKIILKINL